MLIFKINLYVNTFLGLHIYVYVYLILYNKYIDTAFKKTTFKAYLLKLDFRMQSTPAREISECKHTFKFVF